MQLLTEEQADALISFKNELAEYRQPLSQILLSVCQKIDTKIKKLILKKNKSNLGTVQRQVQNPKFLESLVSDGQVEDFVEYLLKQLSPNQWCDIFLSIAEDGQSAKLFAAIEAPRITQENRSQSSKSKSSSSEEPFCCDESQ